MKLAIEDFNRISERRRSSPISCPAVASLPTISIKPEASGSWPSAFWKENSSKELPHGNRRTLAEEAERITETPASRSFVL